jgi:hypothetical protein
VLRKNDEELTDGSAPTIFYKCTVKKVSASAQPAAAGAAPRIPRSTALDACRAVWAAIGGLGEPEAPQPPPGLDGFGRPCCARERLPPVPVAIRAGVGSRERVAHLLSVCARRSGVAAPACVLCQKGGCG